MPLSGRSIEIIAADSVSIPRAEVLRYLGCGLSAPTEEVGALVGDCAAEMERAVSPIAALARLPVSFGGGDALAVGPLEIASADLRRHLEGCFEAVVFAATVGEGADKLIARDGSLSRAAAFDAAGTAAIEAFCDGLENDIRAEAELEGLFTKFRFSPGYGDLALSLQRPLLELLDAEGTLRITLSDTLLMSPMKSVTAIIGVGGTRRRDGCGGCGEGGCGGGCGGCGAKGCAFRKKGEEPEEHGAS